MRTEEHMLSGSILNGRYQIVRQLGEGGMGVVYEAVRLQLQQRCALKIIRPGLRHDPKVADHWGVVRGRFRREALLPCRVNHPGLVTIYDYDELPDGTAYLAMEYLEGQSLATVLAEHGPLPWAYAVDLALQAALALQALHEARLVHRDIKPANLHLLPNGRLKVIDMGILHTEVELQVADGDLTDARTHTGQAIGTPPYMAPEQLQDSRTVDGRADIYALALVLYEMITGQQPFLDLSPADRLVRKFSPQPVPPLRDACPTAPRALEDLLLRCFVTRDERVPTMRRFARELKRVLPPLEDSELTLPEPVARIVRRHGATVALEPPPSPRTPLPGWRVFLPKLRRTLRSAPLLLVFATLLMPRLLKQLPQQEPPALPAQALVQPASPTSTAAPAPRPIARAPVAAISSAVPRGERRAAPATGRLRVRAHAYADIFIDGTPRAEGAPFIYTLPAGRHTVRALFQRGAHDEQHRVSVPAGGTVDLVLNGSPAP